MSASDDVREILSGLRFLHDIDEASLKAIASVAEIQQFPTGAVVFREGMGHPRIYVIIEGSVALEMRVGGRQTKRLQTVGEGELLGWSPLLGSIEMTATARALVPTRAVSIDAAQLIALCEHNPRFGMQFMRRTAQALSNRLAATRLQLMDVYNQELPLGSTDEEV